MSPIHVFNLVGLIFNISGFSYLFVHVDKNLELDNDEVSIHRAKKIKKTTQGYSAIVFGMLLQIASVSIDIFKIQNPYALVSLCSGILFLVFLFAGLVVNCFCFKEIFKLSPELKSITIYKFKIISIYFLSIGLLSFILLAATK